MTTAVNPFLIRKSRGRISLIAADKELAEFMNSVDQYYTTKQLRALLVARFGKERAPSTSSIHRYLQRITKGEQHT